MFTQHLAKLFFFVFLVTYFASVAAGQSISPQERDRICREEDVKAAGNSGDKSFVPYLQA
jgi:hypothetical protein